MTEKLTAAEQYRTKSQKAEVSITVPSGGVFRFLKPSKFMMLFRYGQIPQAASNSAIQSWIAAGVLKPSDVTDDQAEVIDAAIRLRDRVLELSIDPKLVVGEAVNPNELSTDDLSDEDAEFLFKWVGSGGVETAGLGNFPAKTPGGPASRSRGKKRRS